MNRKLILDIAECEFQAGGSFSPKTDKDGVPRRDKATGLPLMAVNLVMWSGDGDNRQAETILVTVATDNPPSLSQMDFVDVTGLEAVPWVPTNGNGVRIAYRAESVKPVQAVASVKSAS
jgi:hypothetical protein